jgi:hypothetical protein
VRSLPFPEEETMIADVLQDAVIHVVAYQGKFPEVYGDIREEIDDVVTTMLNLNLKLDTPPSGELCEGCSRPVVWCRCWWDY